MAPTIASLFFEKRLGDGLAVVQSSILLALGLQRKSIEEIKVSELCLFYLNDVTPDRTATLSGAGTGASHQGRQGDQASG